MGEAPLWLSRAGYDAVIFDLDGVITHTAGLHAASWCRLLEGFLGRRAARAGEDAPAVPESEYYRFANGRTRYDGVADFLAARGVALPPGDPADPPGEGTVCALANQKNALFHELLAARGVELFPATVALIAELRAAAWPLAVVSSSRNCVPLLQAGGLAGAFPIVIDGVEAARLGLPLKPAPDAFLEAARRLALPPARCVVIEDATAGVAAARAGGFGLIIAIDRAGEGAALAAHGAHVVVGDLDAVHVAPAPRAGTSRGS
jgi:alpha,alpha-trehalase